MSGVLLFSLGVVVGCIVTQILFRSMAGFGYFKLDVVSEEDDLYSINIKLIHNQKLNKKKRIILKQEH